MPFTTLTTNGRITVPKALRDRLRLRAGDAVEFIITDDGEIRLRPGRLDVRNLQGALRRPSRKPVSLAAMNDALGTSRCPLP